MTEVSKKEKLSEWVNQYSDELYGYANSRLSDPDLAHDILQEVFFSAFKAMESFKGESSPKTWLYRILKNKIIDYYRSAFHKNQVNESSVGNSDFNENGTWLENIKPQKWNNAEQALETKEFFSILTACTDKLTEQQQIAFKLKYMEGKTSEEICKDLEVTPSNYWVIIHRAKLSLRKCLDQNWFNQ